MNPSEVGPVIEQAVEILRRAGARFAYLHGSRVGGAARLDSDIDIAAFFGDPPPAPYDIILPVGVDLMVLDRAPLELAGRVAAAGQLLLEQDAVARVRWESITRKIYFDERPRLERAHREFRESVRSG